MSWWWWLGFPDRAMELDRQITIMTEKAKQVKRYIYIYTFVVYACMYASLSGVMLLNYVNLSVYINMNFI